MLRAPHAPPGSRSRTWPLLTCAGLALLMAAWQPGFVAAADSLEPVGTFEWDTKAVIGLSGLEVSEDGLVFHAVGDRGWFLSGRFERQDGRISGIVLDRLLPILGNNGLPVAARRVSDWGDAEGLAMAPDGEYWISFERWAHVSRYEAPDRTGHWIKDHQAFRTFADNRQLEALALYPDGTLYTFPEQPLRDGFPIFRLDPEGWVIAGHIAQKDRFAIVGADFDASGQLYLLERKLAFGFWWQNRIRRLRVEAPEAAEILWTGGMGEFNDLLQLPLVRQQRLDQLARGRARADEAVQRGKTGLPRNLLVGGAPDAVRRAVDVVDPEPAADRGIFAGDVGIVAVEHQEAEPFGRKHCEILRNLQVVAAGQDVLRVRRDRLLGAALLAIALAAPEILADRPVDRIAHHVEKPWPLAPADLGDARGNVTELGILTVIDRGIENVAGIGCQMRAIAQPLAAGLNRLLDEEIGLLLRKEGDVGMLCQLVGETRRSALGGSDQEEIW